MDGGEKSWELKWEIRDAKGNLAGGKTGQQRNEVVQDGWESIEIKEEKEQRDAVEEAVSDGTG